MQNNLFEGVFVGGFFLYLHKNHLVYKIIYLSREKRHKSLVHSLGALLEVVHHSVELLFVVHLQSDV